MRLTDAKTRLTAFYWCHLWFLVGASSNSSARFENQCPGAVMRITNFEEQYVLVAWSAWPGSVSRNQLHDRMTVVQLQNVIPACNIQYRPMPCAQIFPKLSGSLSTYAHGDNMSIRNSPAFNRNHHQRSWRLRGESADDLQANYLSVPSRQQPSRNSQRRHQCRSAAAVFYAASQQW